MNRGLLLVCLIAFLNITANALFNFLAAYVVSLGESETLAGYLIAWFFVPYFLCTPLAGRWLDRHQSRTAIVFSSLLIGLGALGYTIPSDSSAWLFLYRFMMGAGTAVFMVAGILYVSRAATPDNRAEYIGYYTAAIIIGQSLTPAIGDAVIAYSGYNGLWYLGAACGLGAALIGLFIQHDQEPAQTANNRSAFSFLKLIALPLYRNVFVASLLAGICFGVTVNFLATFTTRIGLPSAPFFLAYALAVIPIRLVGMRYAQKVGLARFITPSFLLMSLGLLLLSFTNDSVYLLILSAIVFGLGYGYIFPAINTIAANISPDLQRGEVLSTVGMVFMLGYFCFNGICGWLARHAGFSVLFLVLAGLALLGGVLFAWIANANVRAKEAT